MFDYLATYDEGAKSLLEHQLPLHEKFGLPAAVSISAKYLGKKRAVGNSNYDGIEILSADDVQMLNKRYGWALLCHGMTHALITRENATVEMWDAKKKLEDECQVRVRGFCIPGDNSSYDIVAEMAPRFGYECIFTIYDAVNTRPPNDKRICRVPIHTTLPGPYDSAFDPWKRVTQAHHMKGLLVDYCHCPLPEPIDPKKDCSLAEWTSRLSVIAMERNLE